MAHFVRLDTPTGDARWVNPDQVKFLAASDEGLCSVFFTDGEELAFKGTPDEVAGKLERGRVPDAPMIG